MKKVVVFGGGTGLSCLLSGLKLFPLDVTTVIAVSDNGSSTGVLKEELDIPAVGDVGEILQESGNPTFDPDDASSVATALRRALAAVNGPLGAANQAKADAEWNLEKTLDGLETVYSSVRDLKEKADG